MNLIAALLIVLLLQSPLQFEVASIKQNKSGTNSMRNGLSPGGRVDIENMTLAMVIETSNCLEDYQIVGGPDWLNVDRFDIQAAPPADFELKTTAECCPGCSMTPIQLMIQTLLRERFQLKTHRETRLLPVYELNITKAGFKLKEPSATRQIPEMTPPPPGTPPPTDPAGFPTPPKGSVMVMGTGVAATDVPMKVLTSTLSGILGRPVIDKTGIKGNYDFKFAFSRVTLPSNAQLPSPRIDAADPMPSIFTAVQEQLGLRLDSAKGPVEVLVIDSATRP